MISGFLTMMFSGMVLVSGSSLNQRQDGQVGLTDTDILQVCVFWKQSLSILKSIWIDE